MTTSTTSIIKGAMILTIAGLLGKVLSAFYRVPLQNITGDLGFYVYQQVYPILGAALILALYGFPAAVSKLATEEERVSFFPVLLVLSVLCGTASLVGFSQAERLASIMGDERLVPSLESAFFIFLFVPLLSVFRGVFQGNGHMLPTALSQITEQLIRVIGILSVAWMVSRSGDSYMVGKGAVYASFAASTGAFLILVMFMNRHAGVFQWKWKASYKYVKTIVVYGLFISLNYTLLLSLQWIDALTLVPGLVDAGMPLERAKEAKGVFDRGQPLIQLGTVLASSLALALVPSVTRKRWAEEPERMRASVSSAIKFSFVIGLAASLGLILLLPLINPLFFLDSSGTGALQVLMLVIVLSSLQMSTASVLQGLNYIITTGLWIVGGAVLKTIVNLQLVPALGLKGAAIGSVVAVAFVLIGNIVTLGQEMKTNRWMWLPWRPIIVAAIAMTAFVWPVSYLHPWVEGDRFLSLVFTLGVVLVGAAIYLVALLKIGAFTKREVEAMPFSHGWLRLLPKGLKL
ncbi:polysaccharide biosynthesis protein [Halobacillus litoralis]|uniref:putative polysaccharide biosynthesis protein n=1 Tax=Halobacillus litoralis TaxID=45668 RepID=UPI001CD4FD31|nr:polysaccharide biosynthesis protein [Halobacillus litoralis]MCA0972710.1 polysaccharide biosynthesis protein [Halobacillus litoralis]